MGRSINVAFPSIGRALSIDPVMLGWMVTAFLLTIAVFAVPAGRIGDIYGRKKIFLSGVTICMVASFFPLAFHSAPALIFSLPERAAESILPWFTMARSKEARSCFS